MICAILALFLNPIQPRARGAGGFHPPCVCLDQGRIEGGGKRGNTPPEPLRGGNTPPPEQMPND